MKLIIIGPPGSGKGTQSELIEKHFNTEKISPGDILREEIKQNTTIGKKIRDCQDSGRLIEDDIIINLIDKNIKNKEHILLDGFPRTQKQAQFLLEKNIDINFIINIIADDNLILKRLKYRLINNKSQKIYNIIYKKPKIKNKDDINGKKLLLRTDDKYNVIMIRLTHYKKNQDEIINYYKNNSIINIITIVSNNTSSNIFNTIKKNIEYYEKNI